MDIETRECEPIYQQATREISGTARQLFRRRITAPELRLSWATDLFQKTKRLKGV